MIIHWLINYLGVPSPNFLCCAKGLWNWRIAHQFIFALTLMHIGWNRIFLEKLNPEIFPMYVCFPRSLVHLSTLLLYIGQITNFVSFLTWFARTFIRHFYVIDDVKWRHNSQTFSTSLYNGLLTVDPTPLSLPSRHMIFECKLILRKESNVHGPFCYQKTT